MTKPYKYELAYIESTGTQYIDTGVNADSDLGIEYKYQLSTLTNEALRFGAIWTDGSSVRRHHTSLVTSSGGNGYYVGKSNYIAICNADTTQTHTYILDAITQKSYMDGVECSMLYPSQTTFEPFDCEMNYWLFARNSNDASIISYASIKIYSFKMYNRDTLVRDYIPVLDFNNTPAMYDKVSGQLFYNQGTGQFKYAIKPYKCEVEYLGSTSTGTYTSGQYIDTGLDYFADFEITAKQRESAGMKALGTLTTYCVERENATTNAWRFRNGESTFFTTSLLVTDIHTLKWKNDKVYGDGLELGSFAKTTGTNRMYLFAAIPTDLTRINRYPIQIYACKLWHPDTGELVRDFIPVLDNNDVPCMYDKVSKQCFYNQGTGSFLYGRQIKEVAYLESTGTQYIDTRYTGNQNTKISVFAEKLTTTQAQLFGYFETNKSITLQFTQATGPSRFGTFNFVFTDWSVHEKAEYEIDKTGYKKNGVYIATISTEQLFATGNLYLFRCNGSTSISNFRIYLCKIWDNGNLVRDYIPAIDENGVGFMFDKVTHAIYDNIGTGAFLYGARITELGSPSLTLRRKLMMMLARGKKKYKPLKYLESSGTQYIDSGVYGDLNTKVEITYCYNATSSASGSGRVFGSRTSATEDCFAIGSYSGTVEAGTKIMLYFSNTNTGSGTVSTITIGKWYVSNVQNGLYTTNGTKETLPSPPTSFTTPSTLKLFGFDNGGVMACGVCQIASCRIWQNNSLVRDMIPVLDNYGVPCMYDRVTEQLFYNQGTGDFLYEEWDFTPCDYVYANGNAYINTLCYGNSDTKMEMVFDIAEQSTQNRGSMGSRINANSQLLAIGYGVSALASDFNNSSYSTYRAYIDYNTNTKYRAYTSKEKRSITDEATGTVLAENNTLCTDTMSTDALLLGGETGLSYGHIGNIWLGKIWNGDTLVRDYIPVVDGDNRGCFYDKTLNALFYSKGSSDFVGHFIQNGVDYKVVNSITSSGTQYIDTNYTFTSLNHSNKYRFKNITGGSRTPYWIGGSQAPSGGATRSGGIARITADATKVGVGIGNVAAGSATYRTDMPTTDFRTMEIVSKDTNKFDWIVDGTKIYSDIAFTGTSISGVNEYLFAVNVLGGADFFGNSTQMSYQAKENGRIVRNMITVLKGTEAGMFDTIERRWYPNMGTGSFTYTE